MKLTRKLKPLVQFVYYNFFSFFKKTDLLLVHPDHSPLYQLNKIKP
ncbi:hypothetical protein B0O44_101400 [Pedobacter nutrimenti]|jgi:hypothetical protein|uniref:Uncharacterized protein n=1 Tax=Pedobacter nutrimenti TaxID=1241337 RepID=A0A318US66_9SPHI|nr:hypothetical protein B0O44_101400 [Pedobacter nutrimenti]